jgi:hypothetical protein
MTRTEMERFETEIPTASDYTGLDWPAYFAIII